MRPMTSRGTASQARGSWHGERSKHATEPDGPVRAGRGPAEPARRAWPRIRDRGAALVDARKGRGSATGGRLLQPVGADGADPPHGPPGHRPEGPGRIRQDHAALGMLPQGKGNGGTGRVADPGRAGRAADPRSLPGIGLSGGGPERAWRRPGFRRRSDRQPDRESPPGDRHARRAMRSGARRTGAHRRSGVAGAREHAAAMGSTESVLRHRLPGTSRGARHRLVGAGGQHRAVRREPASVFRRRDRRLPGRPAVQARTRRTGAGVRRMAHCASYRPQRTLVGDNRRTGQRPRRRRQLDRIAAMARTGRRRPAIATGRRAVRTNRRRSARRGARGTRLDPAR